MAKSWLELYSLDANTQGFHQPKPRAVQQAGQQLGNTVQFRQEHENLARKEVGRFTCRSRSMTDTGGLCFSLHAGIAARADQVQMRERRADLGYELENLLDLVLDA